MHATANVGQGQVWGRVEHIVSGQVASFQSVAERAIFIIQVLSSATEESDPFAESHDPYGDDLN
jgi:hypothetical protein